MKKRFLRFLALVLAAALLAGCSDGAQSMQQYLSDRVDQVRENISAGPQSGTQPEEEAAPLTFDRMKYEHPDMDALRASLDAAIASAQNSDVETVVGAIYAYYDEYDWFYTCYCLADIRYSQDLTNSYWEEEYSYCVENAATVDAGLEELYYALAASPVRKELEGEDYFGAGFFDSYDGENIWDEAFTALLEREAELENQYYTLTGQAVDHVYGTDVYYDAYADDMAQVLVDLVKVRREMADYWGYRDYASFAWDFYYYRDYTPGEMESYMQAIARELVPLYRQMHSQNVWEGAFDHGSVEDTYAFVKSTAQNLGGIISEAFDVMESQRLYDISYSPNKYATSFEVYLTTYQAPFVFVCPDQVVYDRMTFAHEFGHFCNDYASYGTVAGIDVLEVFSQGMEYLALCYGEGGEALVRIKLADSLATYVEQSAYATFEHRLYNLSDQQLTVQGLYDLYNQVSLEFGFDSVGYDPREFVGVSHFYTNPMYVDSYVVSNDAAMQLYLMERENPGSGLERYTDTLDTVQAYFLAYLQEAELTSPFAKGQLEAMANLFRQELLG